MVLMACPESYGVQVIDGKRVPENLGSERGHEIHEVMSEYVNHCVKKRVPSDWGAFDKLASRKGAEARQILQPLRDGHIIDYRNVVGTELTLSLDEYFQPVSEKAAFQGTLDCLYDLGEGKALIVDYKSHPGPFEADTPQCHLYPLLVFQAYAHIESVEMSLVFVRYKKCVRSVTFSRTDVPFLIDYVQAFRERQVDIHQTGRNALKALPGSHCAYCPRLADVTCPIKEFNPAATHTPEERLRFNIWASQLAVQNTAALKSYVTASEKNVMVTDGNGVEYEYGAWPAVVLEFPLRETHQELERWQKTTREDLISKQVVGATKLKQALKAAKRRDLADAIANHTDPKGTAKWGVKRGGKEEEDEDDDRS